jgi:hypothetical protein
VHFGAEVCEGGSEVHFCSATITSRRDDNYISASSSALRLASLPPFSGWSEELLETTDAQVRKLMDEFGRHGKVGVAALRSGMHRDTAAKYLRERKLPTLLRVAVLVRVPLAATDHLQAGRVDDQMEGAVALPDSARRWSDLAGTASCGRARAARGPSSGPGSPRTPRSAGAPGGTATGASGRSQSRRRSTPSAPTDAPKGGAFQESTASASNQTVMSPRRRSDSSYTAQFRTRYFVLYFGVTLLFVRAAIVVVSRGLASESTVGLRGPEGQEAEPCTNARLQATDRSQVGVCGQGRHRPSLRRERHGG